MESPNALSPQLEKELIELFENYSSAFLSSKLRWILLDYIKNELDKGLPSDFPEFLEHLNALLDLLDLAERETMEWRTEYLER